MNRRALVFFPQNPYPAKTGAHRRFLEVLEALSTLGFKTCLASSSHNTPYPWNSDSAEHLKRLYGLSEVVIYRPNGQTRLIAACLQRLHRLGFDQSRVGSPIYVPREMLGWFRALCERVSPDVIFVSYAYWAELLDRSTARGSLGVIDTLDLVSVNAKLTSYLRSRLPKLPVHPKDVAMTLLGNDVPLECRFEPDEIEFRAFDRADVTIAITENESEIIRRGTSRTRVVWLPVTYRPVETANSYSGNPILPFGQNFFNVLGYAYLMRQVIPRVRERLKSFCIDISGLADSWIQPAEGARFLGFVESIADTYQHARFLAAPKILGSGQQIKIVEAMAHGVPVITTVAGAEGSPMIQGVTGYIAQTAEEFADYTLRLMADRALCEKLGRAGRERVEEVASPRRVLDTLNGFLTEVTSQ